MSDIFGKQEKFSKPSDVVEFYKKEGFDGIKIKGEKGMALGEGKEELMIFDPKNIKTKSQLKDIYNKANKPLGDLTK